MRTKLLIIMLAASLLMLAGCECLSCNKAAEAPKDEPAASSQCPPPSSMNVASATYPCDKCGVVRVDKTMPGSVQVGSEFDYTIKVTNLTDMKLSNVELTENLSDNFKYKSSEPIAKNEGKRLMWLLETLDAHQTKTVKVSGMAAQAAPLATCANISYNMPVCAATQGVQPALQLAKTAPQVVSICDTIPIKYTVTNNGSGPATNIKITDQLPDGLVGQDGKGIVAIDVGILDCGQSKTIPITARAKKTGKYASKAAAKADGGLSAESETTMTVVQKPVLEIIKTGPDNRYIGRAITYDITLNNKGDAPAAKTMIKDEIPAGVKFMSATGGGKVSGSNVVWDIGTLDPGKSVKVSATYMPESAGLVANTAYVTAECADAVSSTSKTTVSGIAAILLEVIDVSDPIEVGSNETYIITVTNQGSANDTKIDIKCMLEANMQYVSSSGPTTGAFSANTVDFAPLASLAPKAKASWQVVVKALDQGDYRFKVVMNSDQLDRDVEETESTHFYK